MLTRLTHNSRVYNLINMNRLPLRFQLGRSSSFLLPHHHLSHISEPCIFPSNFPERKNNKAEVTVGTDGIRTWRRMRGEAERILDRRKRCTWLALSVRSLPLLLLFLSCFEFMEWLSDFKKSVWKGCEMRVWGCDCEWKGIYYGRLIYSVHFQGRVWELI